MPKEKARAAEKAEDAAMTNHRYKTRFISMDQTIDIELTGLETSSGHFTFASTGREMKLRAQFGGKLLNN